MSTNYGPGVTECLYAMPAKGAAMVAASSTVMTQAAAGTAAGGGAFALPPNFFGVPGTTGSGRSLLLKGGGYWSEGATADTLTLTWNLDTVAGTALAGGLLASTGVITPLVTTAGLFTFEIMVTCTLYGSSGTLQTIGELKVGQVPVINGMTGTLGTFGTTSTVNTFMIGGVNAGLTGLNLTQTLAAPNVYYVEMFGAWSATTNAPSITLSNFYVIGLN